MGKRNSDTGNYECKTICNKNLYENPGFHKMFENFQEADHQVQAAMLDLARKVHR